VILSIKSFSLWSNRKSLNTEENISSPSPCIGSDVCFVHQGSKEASFDLSNLPLGGFHDCE
jgi:hypothetical protein